MGSCSDLSDIDKGNCGFVKCSSYAMLSTVPTKCGRTPVNQRQCHGSLIDAPEEGRLVCLVQSHGRVNVAQSSEKVHAVSDRKVSKHTQHITVFLRIGQHSHRPDRVPMLVCFKSTYNGPVSISTGPRSSGRSSGQV